MNMLRLFTVAILCLLFSECSKNDSSLQENQEIIQFADDRVKAICVSNWDLNGDAELSFGEAAAVTSLNGAFEYEENTIRYFDELKYFLGLTSIGADEFWYDESLLLLSIPKNVVKIGSLPSSLRTLRLYNENPNSSYEEKFNSLRSSQTIVYVPKGALDIYLSFDVCKEFYEYGRLKTL